MLYRASYENVVIHASFGCIRTLAVRADVVAVAVTCVAVDVIMAHAVILAGCCRTLVDVWKRMHSADTCIGVLASPAQVRNQGLVNY